MSHFLADNFCLETPIAQKLYHDYAAEMPIFDYHCHLPPAEVAEDKQWENLTQIWLYGDHYKWRAMRTNGVDEKYCTGDVADFDKFMKWAETVPQTIRNPLFVWTHLELKRIFDVHEVLTPQTAQKIFDDTGDKLKTPEFSARAIMKKMNVKIVCTTDDPLDTLAYHQQIAADTSFEVKVLPTWRPDKAMAVEKLGAWNQYLDDLGALTNMEINSSHVLIKALQERHDFFHQAGCRLSDHGLETAYAAPYSDYEINTIFAQARTNKALNAQQIDQFKSYMLYEFAIMDHEKNWTQQFHFGAMRNNNARMMKQLGPDTGFDSIGDVPVALALSRFLDRLDSEDKLAKTILYNLNPRDNEVLATMLGNFQDGSVPGKLQFGSGWWFLDQRDGMTKQLNALSNLSLLSRFVGMLTDSRSFLSYPRHEYFRRILCNVIAQDVLLGEIPEDYDLLGPIVQDISFNNAKNFFGIPLE